MMMRVGCDDKGEKTTEKFVCVVCVCVCGLIGKKSMSYGGQFWKEEPCGIIHLIFISSFRKIFFRQIFFVSEHVSEHKRIFVTFGAIPC